MSILTTAPDASPPRPARLVRRGARVGALVLLVAISVLGGQVLSAPTASAHDQLVGSLPGTEEQVEVAPASVTLRFSEEPLALGAQVQVMGPGGKVVSERAPQVQGASVVQALTADRPSGDYTVAWRVTSTDGHPIEGSFVFTAAAAATAGAGALASDASSASSSPSSTTSSSASASSSSSAAATSPGEASAGDGQDGGLASASADQSGSALWLWAPLVLLAGGLAILALRVRAQRRRG